MKKTLFFGMLLVAIASFGGNIISAHAQTVVPPPEAVVLQQQIAVLKAQLIQLQLQENEIPTPEPAVLGASITVAPPTVSTVTPSPDNLATLNTALNSLKGVLTSLATQSANDPQFLTTNGPTIAASLGNIGSALALVDTSLLAGNTVATAPAPQVASANPTPVLVGNTGTGIAQGTVPAAPSVPVTPATPAPVISQTSPAVGTPETAQASSSISPGNWNWPLIIVVILAIAAIALWLWWPDEDKADTKKPVKMASPVKPVILAPSVETKTVTVTKSATTSTPATPLASAVGAPAEKQETTTVRVTSQQQQQRKSA